MAQPRHRRAPPTQDADATERRELERALIDAERIMMQTVQTSLSLIGFGFTITEFFSGRDLPVDAQPRARLVGEALLVLGLLLLGLGIWTHAQYRARLVRAIRCTGAGPAAFGLRLRDTPSFIIAILLLLVGLLTFVTVAFRRLI
jgi:putative membrane protein